MPSALSLRIQPGLRPYLFLTAAVNGAAVMILEILGAKMLAPFFGTSHVVWTAQIAVTLVALAVGYWQGGLRADRKPEPSGLYAAMVGAAAWMAAACLFTDDIALAATKIPWLPAGTLFASAMLYFVPLCLLAMTGPFFSRLITENTEGVGRNVGTLSAVSTLGSFFGTVGVGFVFIPYFPNTYTLAGTSVVIVALAAIYFFRWRPQSTAPVVAAAVAIAVLIVTAESRIQAARGRNGELFFGNSAFGQLQVLDEKLRGITRRLYRNDHLTQNTYDPQNRQSLSAFTYLLRELARSYNPGLKSALCLGVGVGIVPRELATDGIAVDAVEINPSVIQVASRFFDFNPAAVRLTIGDARQFVLATTNTYDAILLDAFLGDAPPSHLMTREAFADIRKRMNPNGVLVINAFAELEAGKDFFAASLQETLRAVFGTVVIHNTLQGNVFFVACPEPNRAVVAQPDPKRLSYVHIQEAVRNALENKPVMDPTHGRVLTDNFNPVDFYDAANREKVRRLLVASALGQ